MFISACGGHSFIHWILARRRRCTNIEIIFVNDQKPEVIYTLKQKHVVIRIAHMEIKNKNRFLVIPTPHFASRVMSGARTQLYLVGFTLLGGALGFYVEERVESHYKQRRFEAFEAAYEARGGRRKGRGGGEDLEVGASSSSSR